MSAAVVALRSEVNADVVEALEGLLERAKAGEIVALVWSADVRTAWEPGATGCENNFVRLGVLARLMHKIHLAIDEASA